MTYNFKNEYMTLIVKEIADNMLDINGTIVMLSDYTVMTLFAANPIDRMMNYVGSGLAFPNPQIAFENSPNIHSINHTGVFHTIFKKPNAYYSIDTQILVPPSLFIRLEGNTAEPTLVHFKLDNHLPLKTVYYRDERTGPDFYEQRATRLGIRSQEDIIRMY